MHSFKITDENIDKINKWLTEEIYPGILDQQRISLVHDMGEELAKEVTDNFTVPYVGKLGGPITFKFTPMNFGMVVTVVENFSNKEFVLTDIF